MYSALLIKRYYEDAHDTRPQAPLAYAPSLPEALSEHIAVACQSSYLCQMNVDHTMAAIHVRAIEPAYQVSAEYGWCAVSNMIWVFIETSDITMYQENKLVGGVFSLQQGVKGQCMDIRHLDAKEVVEPTALHALITQGFHDHLEGLSFYLIKEPELITSTSGTWFHSPISTIPNCMVPPPITLSVDVDACLNVALPSMNLYLYACDIDRGFLDDAYLRVGEWVRDMLGYAPSHSIDFHPYSEGIPAIRVEDGVIMENLIDWPLSLESLNQGIWASNTEFIQEMEAGFRQGVDGFVQWLATFDITQIYYNTFVSRHTGDYVVYTFSGFSSTKKVVEFQITIFDDDAFEFWFSEMREKSTWCFHHAKSLEFDWGMTLHSSHCIRLDSPERPGCVPTMILLPCEHADVPEHPKDLPKPVDAMAHYELWLPPDMRHVGDKLRKADTHAWLFPAMAFPDDKRDLFALCENIILEAAEDGVAFDTADLHVLHRLSMRMAFELQLQLRQDASPRYAMLLLTDIPQDDFGSLYLHNVLPCGVMPASCQQSIAQVFSIQHISAVSALPRVSEVTRSIGLNDVYDPEESECD